MEMGTILFIFRGIREIINSLLSIIFGGKHFVSLHHFSCNQNWNSVTHCLLIQKGEFSQ
uniref:Uncharacterized protein n=1 Tax=Nelumbo nucifera TaxID=4432 RepID=A0A822ZRY5_NELNU|nr:TPA_asm: hypothetical protein HUJ06_003926 [Nelumbo nucifera]